MTHVDILDVLFCPAIFERIYQSPRFGFRACLKENMDSHLFNKVKPFWMGMLTEWVTILESAVFLGKPSRNIVVMNNASYL